MAQDPRPHVRVVYVLNVAGIAPVLGITEGEIQAGLRKAGERGAVHVLQAVVTAIIAERLASEEGRISASP